MTEYPATEAQAEIANQLSRAARDLVSELLSIQDHSTRALTKHSQGYQVNSDVNHLVSSAQRLNDAQVKVDILVNLATLVELPQELLKLAASGTNAWFHVRRFGS